MDKIIVLKNGVEFPIEGENSKYYLCGNTQFRKSNPQIAEIKEVKYEAEEAEDLPEEKPKKKRTAKKKAEDPVEEIEEEQKGE